ncbi:MAG: glycosyltransferase [Oscillospiraceae bacterium]
MKKLTVGLFNDSFPPTIDGVASVTKNYAEIINRDLGTAVVAIPFFPGVIDRYPFDVIRYPSAYLKKPMGYRAGYPFDPMVLNELEKKKIDIIHSHCPVVSTVLARMLRMLTGAPIVFTYHTKFNIDIEKLTASDSLRRISLKFLINNINACDEVWVVSQGAGENLRSIGYHGEYTVMENGTDFEKSRAETSRVSALRDELSIPDGMTVFLFVGRMMWYKGIKLSLDGLKKAKMQGEKFKYILVGDGEDRPDIERYIKEIGLSEDCIVTGAVHDRKLLQTYFTLADLFLFPSDFDTNGIVVREAAACSCPSLLLTGSCAAEGIVHEDTGILIDAAPDAMCEQIIKACHDHDRLAQIGVNASEKIYISWEDAVGKAYARYEAVIENCKNKKREDESVFTESLNSAVVHIVDALSATKVQLHELFHHRTDKKTDGTKRKAKLFRSRRDK